MNIHEQCNSMNDHKRAGHASTSERSPHPLLSGASLFIDGRPQLLSHYPVTALFEQALGPCRFQHWPALEHARLRDTARRS